MYSSSLDNFFTEHIEETLELQTKLMGQGAQGHLFCSGIGLSRRCEALNDVNKKLLTFEAD